MFVLSPVSARVKKLRDIYREAIPTLDSERTRILTEYYKESMNEVPIIRRAKALQNILSKMTIRVEPDELIVGNIGKYFRGCLLWPEYTGLSWLVRQFDSGFFDEKTAADGKMIMLQEDRDYIRSVEAFWKENGIAAALNAAMPDELETIATANIVSHRWKSEGFAPAGHFNTNYRKAVEKGFGAIKQEALDKLDALRGKVGGQDAEKYFFYKAIVICCDAIIMFSKRFAVECRRQAEGDVTEERRAELLQMADSLEWIMENPARTYWEAAQVVYMYHMVLNTEGSYLGLTIGRFDQHCGDYLERDLAEGRITREFAQEITDCFFLKVADMFMPNVGSYSNNMRLTIGGRKRDGSDATNALTYMCLQASARLKLHDPTQSLCLHKDSPAELWEAGIETAKIVGGIPTLDNADLIIDALHKRGLAIEDARDFCIIGCIEISASGCEFANVSSPFSKTHINVNNIFLQAINNGINPQNGKASGLKTGYLYEMNSFEEVKDAFAKQLEYFMDWHFTLNNLIENVGNRIMQVPMASATMDGCMESGKDMLLGGAKYNSTGNATFGIGTLFDSLAAVKYAIFDKKICTAQELYDAVMANWEGYETLQQRIKTEAPHYGNGDPEVDQIGKWAMDLYVGKVDSLVSARGHHRAGIYGAGANIQQGLETYATPNGRKNKEPVSDGASPVQGMDTCGPTGVALSVTALDPSRFANGMQFCMKFHPSSVQGKEGTEKIRQFVSSFFDMGGMQIQYNVVDAATLRDAQVNPNDYKDLVVRVAGFSAYFVELEQAMQNDLINRTDIAM